MHTKFHDYHPDTNDTDPFFYSVEVLGDGFDFTFNFNYATSSAMIMTLFIQEMIARGIYTNGVFYPCYTLTTEDIEKIISVFDEVFALMKRGINNNQVDELLKYPVRQTGFKRLT